MELMIGVLMLFVLGVGSMAWFDAKKLATRRRLVAERGGFDTLFSAAGLRTVASDEGTYEAVGCDGALVVTLDCASIEDIDASTTLTLSYDMGPLLPAGLSMTMHVLHHDRLDWDQFIVEGQPREVLALKSTRFMSRINVLLGIAREHGSSMVFVEEGVVGLSIGGPHFLFVDERHETLGKLLRAFEQLEEALSHRKSQAAELIDVMRLRSLEDTWDAARELCAHHAESPELSELVASLGHEVLFVRAACLRWGYRLPVFAMLDVEPIDIVEVLSYLLETNEVTHSGVIEEFHNALIHELSWAALFNPSCSLVVRMGAAAFAWGAEDAPSSVSARDAELACLFNSASARGSMSDKAFEVAFRRLTGSGWSPSPQAAVALASGAPKHVRRALAEWIGASSPDPTSYAPALAALRAAGVTRAAALLAELDLDGPGGQLSLAAEDPSGGGLTLSTERGTLSPADEK